MSRRGRRAVPPPAGHRAPSPLAPDGLVVTVVNKAGYEKTFDFAELPVAGPLQRSLARVFAAQSRNWNSHGTGRNYWNKVVLFARFLSELDSPPDDVDGLTVSMLQSWREENIGTNNGKAKLGVIRALLQRDTRMAAGPAAEELARRIPGSTPSKQSYKEAERDLVVLTAQRQFRSAWMRICENTRLLDRWRAGSVPEGGHEWRIGQVLDQIARTGDVPRTLQPSGLQNVTNRSLLGGSSREKTWGRLFLLPAELTALAVLFTDRFGWNLSQYDRMPVPATGPSAGELLSVTYQVQIEKHRAGSGRWFSTENITDSGADSPGRLITQALEATVHARALACRLTPDTDLLMIAHAFQRGKQHTDSDRPAVDRDRPAQVWPLCFGVSDEMSKRWAKNNGLGGSPFQRSRRTTVTDEGRPLQHTQGTHESVYVLPDKRVQEVSRGVFADGALEALDQAQEAVFGGMTAAEPNPEHHATATVDCEDEETSPWPAAGGGCGADFLLCLACPNAHVHPGHHPRLAHLHQQLRSLRSALPEAAWSKDWHDSFLRLEDLRNDSKKIGPAAWKAALARVSDNDRTVVGLLLKGELAP